MEALGLTTNNLKELSIFLFPGLVFIYFFFLQIPDRKKSDLILILLCVLASSFINFLTAYIFGVISFITHLNLHLIYSGAPWLDIIKPYNLYLEYISTVINAITNSKLNLTANDLLFPWARIILSLLLAIVAARFARSSYARFLITKIFRINGYPFGRLWNSFFDVKNKVVRITINGNISYVGFLGRVSTDPADDIQEIELLEPYRYFPDNGSVTRIKETKNMLITGTNIISIEMITEKEAKKIYKPPKN
jgi:hypothetical protein